MLNSDDFFSFIGTTGSPKKKASSAPTRANLNKIRSHVATIDRSQPLSKWIIQSTAPVNILSDEFRTGTPKPVTPPPISPNKAHQPTVIMPANNKPPQVMTAPKAPAMPAKPRLEVVPYSDYSFAIFGEDTKKYKDDLQSLGGKFNQWLKRRNGKPTPGYIYPNWRIEQVNRYMERF